MKRGIDWKNEKEREVERGRWEKRNNSVRGRREPGANKERKNHFSVLTWEAISLPSSLSYLYFNYMQNLNYLFTARKEIIVHIRGKEEKKSSHRQVILYIMPNSLRVLIECHIIYFFLSLPLAVVSVQHFFPGSK